MIIMAVEGRMIKMIIQTQIYIYEGIINIRKK